MSASTTSTKKILIVEPDDALRAALVTAVGRRALAEAYEGFESARPRLSSLTCDLLVTNLRLGEYNGLHLVILVKFAAVETRAIVYADEGDLALASNAQQVGAFFELTRRMPIVLPSYVGPGLPSRDRRNPLTFDRRTQPRGGRRAWDAHLIGSM